MSEKQLLIEVQPGINIGESDLISGDIGAYWLENHVGRLVVTSVDPGILTDYWQVSGSSLSPSDTGSTSENWQNIGGRLSPKE